MFGFESLQQLSDSDATIGSGVIFLIRGRAVGLARTAHTPVLFLLAVLKGAAVVVSSPYCAGRTSLFPFDGSTAARM